MKSQKSTTSSGSAIEISQEGWTKIERVTGRRIPGHIRSWLLAQLQEHDKKSQLLLAIDTKTRRRAIKSIHNCAKSLNQALDTSGELVSGTLSRSGVSLSDLRNITELLERVALLELEEGYGKYKRLSNADIANRLIVTLALAFQASGGHLAITYSPTEEIRIGEFPAFVSALNEFLPDRAKIPGKTSQAIAIRVQRVVGAAMQN